MKINYFHGGIEYWIDTTGYDYSKIKVGDQIICVNNIILGYSSESMFGDIHIVKSLLPDKIFASSWFEDNNDVYVKDGHRNERTKVNEVEAEAIISEIKQLVSNPKYNGRSIGIVSLIGAQQAKYIQEQLLIELGEDVYQDSQPTDPNHSRRSRKL